MADGGEDDGTQLVGVGARRAHEEEGRRAGRGGGVERSGGGVDGGGRQAGEELRRVGRGEGGEQLRTRRRSELAQIGRRLDGGGLFGGGGRRGSGGSRRGVGERLVLGDPVGESMGRPASSMRAERGGNPGDSVRPGDVAGSRLFSLAVLARSAAFSRRFEGEAPNSASC